MERLALNRRGGELVTRRIIGIALLRNEEYFVRWALSNVLAFCDELIAVDTGSSDRTVEKLEALAGAHPHLTLQHATDPNTSHRYIQDLAGEAVWVFGVDGDEIYDPEGLARLRPRLLSGEYDSYWRLDGYMIHPMRVELDRDRATGYMTPHTPPGNKLYNFGALRSWVEPQRERLHGTNMKFREGYSRELRRELFRDAGWAECDLRALHLCFFPRSSGEEGSPARRANPAELRIGELGRVLGRVRDILARPLDRDAGYKARRYRRGPLTTVGISGFRRPDLWARYDDQAREAEEVLGRVWS
jgi:glycosyltransferase involved in cell wall biosynthesis